MLMQIVSTIFWLTLFLQFTGGVKLHNGLGTYTIQCLCRLNILAITLCQCLSYGIRFVSWLKFSTGRFSESEDVSCWGCIANSTLAREETLCSNSRIYWVIRRCPSNGHGKSLLERWRWTACPQTPLAWHYPFLGVVLSQHSWFLWFMTWCPSSKFLPQSGAPQKFFQSGSALAKAGPNVHHSSMLLVINMDVATGRIVTQCQNM